MIRRAAVAVEWAALGSAWVLALALLAGCDAVPVPTVSARPGVEPTPRPLLEVVTPGSAATELETLVVRPPVETPGYRRSAFRHWSDPDRDGCDGREQAIARAAGALRGCPASILFVPDAYTLQPVLVSHADADHAWSLHSAWDGGAAAWTSAQREAFANDPLVVVMTDERINRSKSDRMPNTWSPPNPAARCGYVARLVAVGVKYRLGVTVAEKAAMRRVLGGCPGQALPEEGR